jgi:hypothetical protein
MAVIAFFRLQQPSAPDSGSVSCEFSRGARKDIAAHALLASLPRFPLAFRALVLKMLGPLDQFCRIGQIACGRGGPRKRDLTPAIRNDDAWSVDAGHGLARDHETGLEVSELPLDGREASHVIRFVAGFQGHEHEVLSLPDGRVADARSMNVRHIEMRHRLSYVNHG